MLFQEDSDLTALQNGATVMLMGSAETLPDGPAPVVQFLEDMSRAEQKQSGSVGVLPAGLRNLGNTCYLNATLHMLRAMPELAGALQLSDVLVRIPTILVQLSAAVVLAQSHGASSTHSCDCCQRTVCQHGRRCRGHHPSAFRPGLCRHICYRSSLAPVQAFRTILPEFAQTKDGHQMQHDADEAYNELVNLLGQVLPCLSGTAVVEKTQFM